MNDEMKAARAEIAQLRKEYDAYIDGKPGDWYIVELKKERDEARADVARLNHLVELLVGSVPIQTLDLGQMAALRAKAARLVDFIRALANDPDTPFDISKACVETLAEWESK